MDYYILHKPFGVLSQFTREEPHHKTLADLGEFPKDIYPVGRLDKDSEGLLILTNDPKLNHRLLNPNFRHKRTYLAQVEQIPEKEDLEILEKGVEIKVGKRYHSTLPCKAKLLEPPPSVSERVPSIRYRKSIPTAWIQLTLTEGKNRQVRKMCAKIGFPVLRLIRISIENLSLKQMKSGDLYKIDKAELFHFLFQKSE